MDCVGDVFDGDLFIINNITYECVKRCKFGVSFKGYDKDNNITKDFFFMDDCDIVNKVIKKSNKIYI